MPSIGRSQPTIQSERTSSVDTEALTIPNPDADRARDELPLKGLTRFQKTFTWLRGKQKTTHTAQLENLRKQASKVRIGDGLAALQEKLAEKNWNSPTKLFSTGEMQTLMNEVHATAENHPLEIQFVLDDDIEEDGSVHSEAPQAQQHAAGRQTQLSGVPNEFEFVHRDESNAQARGIHGPSMNDLANDVTERGDIIARTALTNYKSLQQVPHLHNVVTQLMHEPAAVGLVDAGQDYVDQMKQNPNFLATKTTQELTAIVNDLRHIGETFCVAGAPNEITVRNPNQDAALKHNIATAIDTLNMSLLGGTREKTAAINNFIITQLTHVVNDASKTVEDGMVRVQLNHRDAVVKAVLSIAAYEVGAMEAENRKRN